MSAHLDNSGVIEPDDVGVTLERLERGLLVDVLHFHLVRVRENELLERVHSATRGVFHLEDESAPALGLLGEHLELACAHDHAAAHVHKTAAIAPPEWVSYLLHCSHCLPASQGVAARQEQKTARDGPPALAPPDATTMAARKRGLCGTE